MKKALANEIWFIHPNYVPPLPLFYRRTESLGAEVMGGVTGSHRTGHGETYWDKFVEIVKFGYIPVDVAMETGVIGRDWQPPDFGEMDELVRRGICVLRAKME